MAAPAKRDALEAIRAQVLQIERDHHLEAPPRPVVYIAPAIDAALPGGGLATGCVQKTLMGDAGAATGFAAMLLTRLDGIRQRPI